MPHPIGTCIARQYLLLNGNQLRVAGRVTIVIPSPMLLRAAVLMLAFMAAPVPALADARSEAKAQVEFGIKVAQNGLWKEATYRWEKAVQIDPSYAEAWNNLAIAYEQQGDFDNAEEAYSKAVALDPDNIMIRQNYDLFREINDRTKRRRSS
jgi:Tfp pilus assembly protein PilF